MNLSKEKNLDNSPALSGLTVSLHSKMTCSEDDWQRLFLEKPHAVGQDYLGKRRGQFYSILVCHDQNPILFLPLYQIDYQWTSDTPWKETFLPQLFSLLPGAFSRKTLGVGFIDSRMGQIGCDFTYPAETLQFAWSLALEVLEQFAVQSNVGLICFSTPHSGQKQFLQKHTFKSYCYAQQSSEAIEKERSENNASFSWIMAKYSPWRWLYPHVKTQILHTIQAKDEAKILEL